MTDLDQLTLSITEELIRKRSVSPDDDGCQALLVDYLEDMGFTIEHMPFGNVTNFWATRTGTSPAPILAFAGHTDVVPSGPLQEWHSDPFEPVYADGKLFGRGAADMKGALAAMITGIRRFLDSGKPYKGTIALLITSDEEADAINGTVKVVQALTKRGTNIDWCVVGEPTSTDNVGDVIKVGRRGSMNGTLRIIGKQGHVAYPDDAINPVHQSMAALAELAAETWDAGNEFFPATTMQISNINAGTGATNVIPGELIVNFNFRYSTESTDESLKTRTIDILNKHNLNFEIDWKTSGQPFITENGRLIPALRKTIKESLGIDTELSTSGGTSDGRFIAPTGTEVAELGVCNSTIHKVNECVVSDELKQLSRVYTRLLGNLLTD
ncbi:MAG: succinyl-diaminopimelate desuccinylase [Pseudomonadales bacterium]|nr:succinyl-diaminopimelate desuccinylase [Pseudomonadales bacterium]